MAKLKKDDCIELLQSKSKRLSENKCLRLPQRSDFSAEEIQSIKALLGPWPRALEAAGLKPPRNTDSRSPKNKTAL